MSRLLSLITVIAACGWLAACSTVTTDSPAKPRTATSSHSKPTYPSSIVKEKLYTHYGQWKGTKYKMGGLSENGVDCSGFVYLTYRHVFGVELPRSTESQSRVGQEIAVNALKSGDLIFFKTDKKVRHVGIYVGDKSFLHASTKNGVMISRLDDYYWKSKYWHARRFIF